MPSRHLLLSAVLAVSGAAGLAHAQMPPWTEAGQGRYVCGGIGSDESTAMRLAMKSHPLSLLFARADGAYLATVAVDIRSAQGGPGLSLRADGPVCLVDLPAGAYVVEATFEGRTQRREVSLGGGPRTADFRF